MSAGNVVSCKGGRPLGCHDAHDEPAPDHPRDRCSLDRHSASAWHLSNIVRVAGTALCSPQLPEFIETTTDTTTDWSVSCLSGSEPDISHLPWTRSFVAWVGAEHLAGPAVPLLCGPSGVQRTLCVQAAKSRGQAK